MSIGEHVQTKVCLPVNQQKFYDCKKRKACSHVLNIPSMEQKLTITVIGGDGNHCFVRKTSRDYEKQKPSPFYRDFAANHNQARPSLCHKRKKSFHFWHTRVNSPLIDTVNQKFGCIVNCETVCWSLDFEPDSVTLIIKGLIQEIPPAFWSLLLYQRQTF